MCKHSKDEENNTFFLNYFPKFDHGSSVGTDSGTRHSDAPTKQWRIYGA